jgi:hypothetical protein
MGGARWRSTCHSLSKRSRTWTRGEAGVRRSSCAVATRLREGCDAGSSKPPESLFSLASRPGLRLVSELGHGWSVCITLKHFTRPAQNVP